MAGPDGSVGEPLDPCQPTVYPLPHRRQSGTNKPGPMQFIAGPTPRCAQPPPHPPHVGSLEADAASMASGPQWAD